jgi:hypothetical protein
MNAENAMNAENSRAKASSGWRRTGLSRMLDQFLLGLPYDFRRCGTGSGRKTFFGTTTDGSSRSGAYRIRLSPYRLGAQKSHQRPASILPNSAKRSITTVPGAPTVRGVPGIAGVIKL